MPDNTIKTTLAIDGEQKYKRAIDEAKASIRNMGTALTLATAEFKRDGDAMKLMQSRAKTLKDEISQQQQIVRSLEGAVKEATTAYGENSKQAEKWQAELNRAKAALAGLEAEYNNNAIGLDKNGKEFKAAGAAAGKFGEDVKKAGKTANAVNFLALDKALTNTSNLLSGLMKGIYNVGRAGWGFVTDAASWADELGTRSKTTGLDVVTLQQWDFAAQMIETDVDTMVSAMDKLQKGGSNVDSALKSLGIKAKDYVWFYDENGAVGVKEVVTPTIDLFWQVVEALGAMNDEEQRNAITQELFGKSYREMLPLIDAGKEGWDEAAGKAKTVSEENVAKLADFKDSLDILNQSFETLKHTFAAELAPSLQTIATTFTDLIGRFQQWAESEAGKDALSKLGGAIESVFTAFADHADFEAIVTGVTGAIQGLTGALDWVSENSDTVATGLLVILGALAGFKVVGAFNNALQLINALKGLNSGSNGHGGLPTVGSPTNTGTQNTATENVTTENVTTQNVTTQNATTQNATSANVTTENVGTANMTAATVTSLNATAENVATENVQTMIVGTMIGGGGNLNPPGGGNGRSYLPSGDGSFNLYGGSPVLIHGNGGTGTNLYGGDTPSLPAGGSPTTYGSDGNVIRLNPSQYQIDGQNGGQGGGFWAGLGTAIGNLLRSPLGVASAALGGVMIDNWFRYGSPTTFIPSTADDEGDYYRWVKSQPADMFYDENGHLLPQYQNTGMSALADTLDEEVISRMSLSMYQVADAVVDGAKAAAEATAQSEAVRAVGMEAMKEEAARRAEDIEADYQDMMEEAGKAPSWAEAKARAEGKAWVANEPAESQYDKLARIFKYDGDPYNDEFVLSAFQDFMAETNRLAAQSGGQGVSGYWASLGVTTEDVNAFREFAEASAARIREAEEAEAAARKAEEDASIAFEKANQPQGYDASAAWLAENLGVTDLQSALDLYNDIMGRMEQAGLPEPDHSILDQFSMLFGDWEALKYMVENGQALVDLMDAVGGEASESLPDDAKQIGAQTAQGLADGIDENADAAVQAAARMAAAVREAVSSALKIASPSRVMMELGGFVTSGFAQGIDGSVDRVRAAVSRMSAAVTARPVASYGGAAGTYYGQRYDNRRTWNVGAVNLNGVRDVSDLMAQMDDQNRYERQGMGVM